MKLQDYICFYIGQKCINTWFPEGHEMYLNGWTLTSYNHTQSRPYQLDNEYDHTLTDSIKLILRKLEDITEEECDVYNKIRVTMHSINKVQDQMKTDAAATYYLLKQGFDLFGLIEAGLAIDQKCLK